MKNLYERGERSAVININTREGEKYVIVDIDMLAYVEDISDSWGIYKDKQGRELPRSGKASGQVLMHKLIIGEVPRGSRLEFINGDSLDLRRENLKLVNKDTGIITFFAPQPEPEPKPERITAADVEAFRDSMMNKPEPEMMFTYCVRCGIGIMSPAQFCPSCQDDLERIEQQEKAKKPRRASPALKSKRDMKHNPGCSCFDCRAAREYKSDVPGVYYHKASQRWNARPYKDGKKHSLGYYKEQAVAEQVAKKFIEGMN